MQYVPLWESILESPKLFKLPPEVFAFWIKTLVVVQKWDFREGSLPDLENHAFSLRMSMEECERLRASLATHGLIDPTAEGWGMHDWLDWRSKEGASSTDRVRRYRERKKAALHETNSPVSPLLHETLHETSSETRSETLLKRSDVSTVSHETRPAFPVTSSETGVKRDVTPSIQHTADNRQQTNTTTTTTRARLGGEPTVSVGGRFTDEPPLSACSADEIDRLTKFAIQAFSPLGNGDVWVRRIRTFAAIYPAAWIEGLIPALASKATDDPTLGESYASKTLQRWAKAGGPPADFTPSPLLGGPSPERRAASPPRPSTEHQRKMARYRERSRELDSIIAAQEAAEQEGGTDERIA